MSKLMCPHGKQEMSLSSPDYGYGYGSEWACYCNGRRNTYSSNSFTEEQKRTAGIESRASLALSRSNAERIRREREERDDDGAIIGTVLGAVAEALIDAATSDSSSTSSDSGGFSGGGGDFGGGGASSDF